MDGLETVFKGDQPNQGIEIGKDGQGLGGWEIITKLLAVDGTGTTGSVTYLHMPLNCLSPIW